MEEGNTTTEVKEERTIAILLLTGVVFILPLFFVPFFAAGSTFGKQLLLALGVFTALGFLIVRELRAPTLQLPKTLLLLAALLVPLAYLIASFFAPAFPLSFFGQGFETDTTFTVLLLFVGFFTALLACRTKGNAVYVFVSLLAAFALLALFHLIRITFGPDVLSLGIFESRTAGPIGRWNDLGIFCGLIGILSWFTVSELSPRGMFRIVLLIALGLSLALLAVVNFTLVWMVLGSFAALLISHAFWARGKGVPGTVPRSSWHRLPLLSLVVLIVSLFFVLDSYSPALFGRESVVERLVTNALNVVQLEARPSWGTTAAIAKSVYRERPLFGSGPNTFTAEWLLHKPPAVNQTIFWDTAFASGIGFVPTSFVTAGIAGGIAWLFFFIMFLLLGIRSFLATISDPLLRYLTRASFLLSAYLWLFAVLYVQSIALLGLAAILSGVCVSLARQAGILKTKTFSLTAHPRLGFVSSLALIVLLIVGLVGVYTIGRKFVSAFYFERATAALNAQDIEAADRAVLRALAIAASDRYEQVAAQIAVSRIVRSLAENPDPPERELEILRSQVQAAVGHALSAVSYNERNYYNWLTVGQVYGTLARLNVSGAYDNAVAAYDRAALLNPTTPVVAQNRAQLEAARGNFDEARTFITDALNRKPDYTGAIVLLAQIQILSGEDEEAVTSLKAAVQASPTNPVIAFQLGFLEYSRKNYQGAAEALERAIALAENYANARYFLGLSYFYLDRAADAEAQFERIEEGNPDNAEVKLILENLRSGKDPLSDIPPPAPERRTTPPLNE